MSAFPGPWNAIVYAQFNLQGRWNRLLTVAGGYFAIIGAAIWLSTLNSPHFTPRDLAGWVGGLAALQMFNLLIFGSVRVENAVRNDVTSRMIESHRLMPASPLSSILGYLFGAPLQVYLLAVANLVLGAICCAIAGLSLNTWLMLNGLLLFLSLFIYAMLAQFSFVSRGGFILLLVAGGACISGASGGGLMMIPSVNLLLAPFLSNMSIFVQMFNMPRMSGDSNLVKAFGISLIAQAIIGFIAIRTAMRRYVSSDTVGIIASVGLLMLAVWVGLAVMAFSIPEVNSDRRGYDLHGDDLAAQIVATFATSMLIALLPIASSARTARQRARNAGRLTTDFSVMWSVLMAAGIVSLLLLNLPVRYNTPLSLRRISSASVPGWTAVDSYFRAGALTTAIVVNFLISNALIFCWGYMVIRRAWFFAIIWLVITWLGPVIADAVLRASSDTAIDRPTTLTALSVPGSLALIWSHSDVNIRDGIVGQVLLSMIPCGLFIFTQYKFRARRRALQEQIQPLEIN